MLNDEECEIILILIPVSWDAHARHVAIGEEHGGLRRWRDLRFFQV